MAKGRFVLLFISMIFASFSCEDEFIRNYDIDIGKYELLDSSKDSMPYKGMENAIFRDSAGAEIIFRVDVSDAYISEGGGVAYDVFEQGDTIKYKYEFERITVHLSSLPLNMNFYFSLDAKPYRDDIDAGFVADVTAIYLDLENKPETRLLVFRDITEQRSWPSSTTIESLNEYTCHGEVFNDVLYSDSPTANSDVFFNYEYGIVSFTDRDGKKWVLIELV